jgi:hypothetical protein
VTIGVFKSKTDKLNREFNAAGAVTIWDAHERGAIPDLITS